MKHVFICLILILNIYASAASMPSISNQVKAQQTVKKPIVNAKSQANLDSIKKLKQDRLKKFLATIEKLKAHKAIVKKPTTPLKK